MIYCNPVPIASASLLGTDVVKDALATLFLGIQDLIKYGRDLDLAFGFCNIRIVNKSLTAHFNPSFTNQLHDKLFETKMQRSVTPVSSIWKTSYTQKFALSTMGTLIMKPNNEVV